jgi:solute carrier family 25 carnitine/acylcarnitine transporter 20/29
MVVMSKTEGLFSLYRGLLSPVMGYGLIKATAFGSYAQFKNAVRYHGWNPADDSRLLTYSELGVAAVGAGFCQSFVRAPVEQIKIVMQARNKANNPLLPPYKSTFHCLVHVLKTEGVRVGLFRGMNATIIREMPQYGIYYPSYEFITRNLSKKGDGKDLSAPMTALSGGLAGVAQWIPTYSFDVVKSRIQAAEPGTYASPMDCARQVYQKEGISAFGRGFGACIARAFPLHGAIFLGYELTMKFLK